MAREIKTGEIVALKRIRMENEREGVLLLLLLSLLINIYTCIFLPSCVCFSDCSLLVHITRILSNELSSSLLCFYSFL